MNRMPSRLGRADLLRVLVHAGGEGTEGPDARRWAAALDFFAKPEESAPGQTTEVYRPTLPLILEVVPGSSTPRAPLRAPLFAITACERVEAAVTQDEPAPPSSGLTNADCRPRDPDGQLAFHPLVRPGRLWPRLKRAVSHSFESRRPDLPRVLAALSRGCPLTRLPGQRQALLATEVVLVVDHERHLAPYRQDWQRVIDELARLLGHRALSIWTVRGDPVRPIGLWRHGAEQACPGRIETPPRGAVALLLSDLGALRHPDGTAMATRGWACFIRRVNRDGVRVHACLPMSPALLPAELGRGLTILPLLNRPGRRWLRWGGPTRPDAHHLAAGPLDRLLTLLACARRIEPELIRALRLLDPVLTAEPGLEALVWSHPGAMQPDEAICLWRPDRAADYRRRFADLPAPLQLAALDILLDIHRVRGRAIEAQELLAWASHVVPETARARQDWIDQALGWWRGFARDAGQATDDRELTAFAAQTVEAQGADKALMQTHAGALGPVWAVTYVHGRSSEVPQGLPVERLAEWVHRHLGPASPATYRLAQGQDRLLLLPAGEGGGQSPLGMPLTLAEIELRASAGPRRFLRPGGQATELTRLAPGRSWTLAAQGLRHTVSQLARPAWAGEFGRDRYGAYADLTLNGVIQRLRWIEPGEFWMGSSEGEAERDSDEGPRHRVLISRGFWLADSACTQALWQAVMGGTPSSFREGEEAPQRPVEQVSWDNVQGFLSRLRDFLPGGLADLPTEAEWEYACRAGTETPFSFGETITTEQVNYNGNYPYAGGKKGEYRRATVPVKSLPANRWGLYEMHGNVWEWCADVLRDYQDRSETDPRGEEGGAGRVARGGSWFAHAWGAHSAFRLAFPRDFRNGNLGFRFALRSQEPGLARPPLEGAREEAARSAAPDRPEAGPKKKGKR